MSVFNVHYLQEKGHRHDHRRQQREDGHHEPDLDVGGIPLDDADHHERFEWHAGQWDDDDHEHDVSWKKS